MKKEFLKYLKTLSDNEEIQELLFKTIGNILLRQNNIEQYIKENENKIIHIRDWITSVMENNEEWKTPRVLIIDALNNAADKYFEKKNNKLQTIELDETHEKLIADLDGYYVVQMLTPQALDKESKQMQHCIGHGGYDEKLKYEEYQYLSLRDKFNKAHVTIEIKNNKIIQLQGKQNKLPEFKYLEKIVYWLIINNYEVNLNNYEVIFNKNDNKIYSIHEIPENCEVDGNLFLSYTKIKKLPNNLTVNGELNLNNCLCLKRLPKKLVVKKSIYLYKSIIKNIPKDVKIGGSIYLEESLIEKIPDNFTVNGSLHLEDCVKLENLPKKLFVRGGLYLRRIKSITELPNDIEVLGEIDLSDTGIRYVSNLIKYNGSLLLNNTNIKELPDNLKIGYDLSLDNTKIKKLPRGLSVHSLFLEKTDIRELPSDIEIKGDLDLKGSKIEKLPDNLVIDNLNLSYCDYIKEIPKGLTVNGLLNLSGARNIKKINENITLGGLITNYENLNFSKNMKIKNDLDLSFSGQEELPDGFKIDGFLDIAYSKIKKLPDDLKCKEICITEEQIYLIKETMNIKKIHLEDKSYSKKKFFGIFKSEIKIDTINNI